MTDPTPGASVELSAAIVSAYVSNNNVRAADLPDLLRSVHVALGNLLNPPPPAIEETKATPGQIRKSITPDALISFIDGKPYRTLKRHLSSKGMTPAAYREKFGLPPMYPMVAESYAAQRAELAKSHGLGKSRQEAAPAKAAAPDAAVKEPAKRGRKPKAAASE